MILYHPALSIHRVAERFAPYAERLQAIYTAMDAAYSAIAEQYRFVCPGCEDSCCRTLFYHHTYVEWFYLHHGWETMASRQQSAIQSRAKEFCRQVEADAPLKEKRLRMCPLNNGGLCGLYAYRPMICRLHGIPHSLRRPDGRQTVGPGCDVFYRQCAARSDAILERTPHYTALAALEQDFRRATGLSDRLKLTVADMIVRFT
jgi:Fe-S-cluster containining protein